MSEAGDRSGDVDGGSSAASKSATREDDMSIEEAFDLITERIALCFFVGEYGVDRGYGAVFVRSGTFKEARELGVDRGGESVTDRDFARGESDLSECARCAGERVHEEEDTASVAPVVFGDRRRGPRGVGAAERRLIAG
jgi:hypothetical protein